MAETTETAVETAAPVILPDNIKARPGKYLTFLLGDEQYGLDILKVQEIIGLMPITRVPKTPDYIRGVINLRGKVNPIVDLRLKFVMEEQEDTRKTCIVVLQLTGEEGAVMPLGIVVDEVAEVVDISAEHLQPPPSFGASVGDDVILGIGRFDERVILLLDVEKMFSEEEIAVVQGMN